MDSYTCPSCKAVSYNPHDKIEKYCGKCHKFEDDWKNVRVEELIREAEGNG